MGLRGGQCRRGRGIHTGKPGGRSSPAFTYSPFDIQVESLDDEAFPHAFKGKIILATTGGGPGSSTGVKPS